MFLPSRRAPRTPSALRGRLTLLIPLVVLAGSPWVQRPVRNLYEEEFYRQLRTDEEPLRWLLEAAALPSWALSSERYGSTSALVVNDLSVLVLLVALVLLARRLSARGASGLLRCLVAGVLASALANLSWWGMHEAFVDDVLLAPADTLVKDLLRSALLFGLAVGALLALLTAGLPRGVTPGSAGAGAAPLRRWKEGGPGMTTAPVHMPVGSAPGDVTRYLCAAAYLDEDFADRVVEDLLADEAGAVAVSPGVDLVTVARHCLTAQEMRHRRDLRLTAAVGLVAVFAPLWLVFVTMLLSVTRQSGGRPSLATRGRHQPGDRALIGTGITAGVAVLLAFAFGVVVSSLPTPGFVSWLLGAYLAGVPAALVYIGAVAFAYVTVVRHELEVDRLLRTTMTREAFARQPRPTVPRRKWMAGRLAAIREAQDGNVTVYSGYAPFIGYSGAASQWPLAVPMLPADTPVGGNSRPAVPEPFTVTELVDHVRARLRATSARGTADGTAAAGEESLGALVIEDRIFASGTSIGDDERFIRTTSLAPAGRVSADEVERIVERPTGAVRHCLAVHVPLWGGDVVPSVFLHFSTTGRTLHLYCSNHVLGPVRADYHVVDRLRGPLTADARRGLLLDAVSRTGGAFFAAPFRALHQARFETRHNRRMTDELKALEQDPVYDFGARLSVRELALSPNYHNYFQVVDATRITSLVERHTLAAIREFLDTRGYDTTDFRAQQQTILNQGLIQQGGMSIIGNQAIGAGATATQNVPQQSGTAALGGVGGSGK
ncbi:hypothetical protein OHT57_38960 [Streptomyces sp. NBC_00285]|uniref:hypothetical protein n=1 Tax=Streptomyces sp. NBC_00285 TaxID=2975700 RepID=UPI002E2B50A1|nr:hypothetical protein [Streptomyces sp. NBC_00285]